MVEGCGGHSTVDALLPGHRTMVRDCVVEESQFLISFCLATVDLVLFGYYWGTIQDRA